jgi:hypothetical protein
MTPEKIRELIELARRNYKTPSIPQKMADALEHLLQYVEWQPIETAPKDGTRIILAMAEDRDGPLVGEGYYTDGEWWWSGTGPHIYHCGGPISEMNFGKVSHWQPMPDFAPPSDKEGE